MQRQVWQFLKENPVPIIALLGLASGLAALAFGQEDAANLVWYSALVVGGAPLVWATLKGMTCCSTHLPPPSS